MAKRHPLPSQKQVPSAKEDLEFRISLAATGGDDFVTSLEVMRLAFQSQPGDSCCAESFCSQGCALASRWSGPNSARPVGNVSEMCWLCARALALR